MFLYASMALGHQKNIAIFAVGLPTHQIVVEHVRDFDARERRRNVQRADLLRDVENALAEREAAPTCCRDVEEVSHGYFIHGADTSVPRARRSRPGPRPATR